MAPSIIDSEDNLLIVPEANADIFAQYKYIKKGGLVAFIRLLSND